MATPDKLTKDDYMVIERPDLVKFETRQLPESFQKRKLNKSSKYEELFKTLLKVYTSKNKGQAVYVEGYDKLKDANNGAIFLCKKLRPDLIVRVRREPGIDAGGYLFLDARKPNG